MNRFALGTVFGLATLAGLGLDGVQTADAQTRVGIGVNINVNRGPGWNPGIVPPPFGSPVPPPGFGRPFPPAPPVALPVPPRCGTPVPPPCGTPPVIVQPRPIWIPPVYETVYRQVVVPAVIEHRPVTYREFDGRLVTIIKPVVVRPSFVKTFAEQVLVRPGYWQTPGVPVPGPFAGGHHPHHF